MKYDEFHKLIEEPNTEKKQALFNKAMEGLALPVEIQCVASAAEPVKKPAGKRRIKHFFKQPARLAACVSLATAVVCLAIILPFALNNDDGLQAATPTPTPPQVSTTTDRFVKIEDCEEVELKYSLKEYCESNGLSLLYVDWYDKAEIKTSMHVNKENSFDIVFYQEILKHRRGSIIDLYITDLHTHVDRFDEYTKLCKNHYVKNLPKVQVKVVWGVDGVLNGEPYAYKAWFKYGEYLYFINLMYPMTENDIFEVIDSMLA